MPTILRRLFQRRISSGAQRHDRQGLSAESSGVTPLSDDPRWQHFNDKNFACTCCGQSHSGVFDISFDHPDSWPHGSLIDSGQANLRVGQDFLNPDICLHGEFRFIKALLRFPILGSDQYFAFGVYVSLKPENFEALLKAEDAGTLDKVDPMFCWVSHALPYFDTTEFLPANVSGFSPDLRAFVTLDPECGTIAQAQSDGITFDQLLDLYSATGTDIRNHLNS